MGILGGLGFAAIFYAMAEYEHMSGWKWAIASIAISFTVRRLFPLSFIFILPAQFGLFCVLWYMNIRRQKELEVERAQRADEDRRRRQERLRQSQAQAESDPDRVKREAAQAAREAAELRERQERVRRARAEREREEREQANRDKGVSAS